MIWNQNKVNYPFIFEFDQRHHLDWRELAQFPSFFFLVLGLFMWVNFSRYGDPDMYIYYPVILICFTVLILFFPAPTILHRSRRWFAYSHVSLARSLVNIN
jgi:cell division protein FtsW (lipid II flippase)